ncbi:MAG: PilZ domain-containing protein [Acidobacteriota bacterium]
MSTKSPASPAPAEDESRGLFGTIHSQTTGRILNLSVAGMAVETEARLNVGESYRIGSPMNQDGRVVWCHFRPRGNAPGESVAAFKSGIEFAATVSENATQILDFIDRVGNAGASRRVFGRFEIGDAEVPFSSSHPCSILSLEDDTMTVEADLLPSLDTEFELEVEGLEGRLRCQVIGIHPLSSAESVDPASRLRLRVEPKDRLGPVREAFEQASSD